jgi:beta-lactamase class A
MGIDARPGRERRGRRKRLLFFALLAVLLTSSVAWAGPGSPGTEPGSTGTRTAAVADTASLSEMMRGTAAKYAGDYGMMLRVAKTGEEAGYQSDKPFYAASCYKLFLTMYIYESTAAGAINLESTITYQSGDYSSGCGIIQFMPRGLAFTTRQLCEYAIVYSDNIAAKMLKRVYGYHAFRDYARSLGCPVTGTYGPNMTTAREICTGLCRLLQFAEVNPLGEEVIDYLRRSIYKSRIPAGLPQEVAVGNKTGDYGAYLNDAAVIFLEETPYVLCILSSGASGDHGHVEVSRNAYDSLAHRCCGGGHCTSGSTQPATQWYFAEGTTRSGFETWLCLANPGEQAAEVVVTTMDQNGTSVDHPVLIPPRSRSSLLMNELAGPDLDIAISVTSKQPILAERPMYFRYWDKWSGGHCTSGSTQPATQWYFAEGTTRSGFETWLCLANPGEQAAEVSVDYLFGAEPAIARNYVLAPHCRYSLLLNQEVGEGRDVSVSVRSDEPILAERPMYFDYPSKGSGGSCVSGINAAAPQWYFAEGCSREGFDTWLCIGNPNPRVVVANITLMDETGGETAKELYIAPRSRYSIRLNDLVEGGHDISVVVSANSGIVVERPVYFLFSPLSFTR